MSVRLFIAICHKIKNDLESNDEFVRNLAQEEYKSEKRRYLLYVNSIRDYLVKIVNFYVATKKYAEAIEICDFAIKQCLIDYTKTGWEGRRKRIVNKRQ